MTPPLLQMKSPPRVPATPSFPALFPELARGCHARESTAATGTCLPPSPMRMGSHDRGASRGNTPADGAVHVALSLRYRSQNPSIQSRRLAYTPCTLATCLSQPLAARASKTKGKTLGLCVVLYLGTPRRKHRSQERLGDPAGVKGTGLQQFRTGWLHCCGVGDPPAASASHGRLAARVQTAGRLAARH